MITQHGMGLAGISGSYSGLGGFWDDVGSFFDTLSKWIAKYGNQIAPVLNAIPVAGSFLSMGVMVAANARKMYDAYKKGDYKGGAEAAGGAYEAISGLGSLSGWKEDLERDMTALAIYNYDRKKRGLKPWNGTWQQLKAKMNREFNKVASGTKKRMYTARLHDWEAYYDLGVKQIKGASGGLVRSKLPENDLSLSDSQIYKAWGKIEGSADFNRLARGTKKNAFKKSRF